MRNWSYLTLPLILMVACSGQDASVQGSGASACSNVKALPVSGSVVEKALKDGKMQAGWGGVLDLLEDPKNPSKSARQRCTVFMDIALNEEGQLLGGNRLGFWTAEHCLKWTKAQGAEINIFDPSKKKYIKFAIQLDEFERFKAGLELFKRHAPGEVGKYLQASNRAPAGIIERGIPACLAETEKIQQQDPEMGVVCSSVLDMARLEATVPANELARKDVVETLTRMNAEIASKDAQAKAQAAALSSLSFSQQQSKYLVLWLNKWRPRVSEITQWRGYESLAGIIEAVRNCKVSDSVGLCNPAIRDFFSAPLQDYNSLAGGNQTTYEAFLKSEANAPTSETKNKFNVPWLLDSQKSVQFSMSLSTQAFFSTNFLKSVVTAAEQNQKMTLGTDGPLFYAAAPINALMSDQGTELSESLVFGDKTIIFKYPKKSAGNTFLMQPGDSGTTLLVGNMPIGVVSTVDGKETSGGSAVLPLPELQDDSDQGASSKQMVSVKCK